MYVQYGCGFSAPDGWMNFDASPTLRFERVPLIGRLYTRNARRFPASARFGDVVYGLPIQPGTVRGLFASHVLEHLSLADCRKALRNSHVYLAQGGIFRLIVPDLRARAERYVRQQDENAANEFLECLNMGEEGPSGTVRGRLSALVGNSRHRWMYDEASMRRELAAAGFVAIRKCVFGDCSDPMFARVEDMARFKDGQFLECALECRKP